MHNPVMLKEALEGLALKPDSCVVDATLGGGGHAEAILRVLGVDGVLLGLDRDPAAIVRVEERLRGYPAKLLLRRTDFAEIGVVARECGLTRVDGVLMDLGVSSFQLDCAERGFSFRYAGPLDMRMDTDAALTAADIVNGYGEEEIVKILWRLGEERSARAIARRIVRERDLAPIEDTERLAELVSAVKGGRRGRRHPATKTFMALRMAVNTELESLRLGLEAGLKLLAVGGRFSVISFHSLEDRIVKHFFRAHVGCNESLQAGGSCWVGETPPVRLVRKKPILPGGVEIGENPRARSAKLRIAERIG